MAKYAHPEVLVTTDWVKDNLDKPGIKLVEIDVDTKAYEAGHITGAIGFNWQTQLQDQVRRDILNKEGFEKLVSSVRLVAVQNLRPQRRAADERWPSEVAE